MINKKIINVSISKKSNSGIIGPTSPVTLKNVPTINVGVDRLDKLTDVYAAGEIAGAVPVYDSVTDKYIVKKLDLGNDLIGDLDGGTF